MRVLVVDDEELARHRLLRLLRDIANVSVVGEAADGEAALAMIDLHEPDLLLLDVRMPALDGIALASRHRSLPAVVFVTAYSEFAVQAFELHAVDYLLKPVRPERLSAAIERARGRVASTTSASRVLETIAPTSRSPRIVAASKGVTRFFDARSLSRLWSQDKYTVFLSEAEEHMTEESLSSLEARLAPHGFLRVHRAEMVNLAMARALRTEDGASVLELSDGQRAQVSRRSLAQVKIALGL